MFSIFAEFVVPLHNWTVSVGNWEFGVQSYDDYIIYFGSYVRMTESSAPTILSVATAALLTLTLATAFVVTHFRAKPEKGA